MPHLFPSERFRTSPKEVWTTAFQDLGQRTADSLPRAQDPMRITASVSARAEKKSTTARAARSCSRVGYTA